MIHPTAQAGFRGDLYERARPDYPDDAVYALLDAVGAHKGLNVDLGAGTGKLTRLVHELNVETIAIDPLPDMLGSLRKITPDIPALVGTAESIPLLDDAAVAIVCAQSFHWFDPERALPEIHRVIKPGGTLGLIWNRRDPDVGWLSRLWGLVDEYRGRTPGQLTANWYEALTTSPYFGELNHSAFDHVQCCDMDGLIERIGSTSFINALPDDEKRGLFARVRRFCATDGALTGKDTFELAYKTLVYWTNSI